MPWKLKGNCVHKENPDGSTGAVVKCHDSPAEAKAHMDALYANMPKGEGEMGKMMGKMMDEAERIVEAQLTAPKAPRTGYFAEWVDLREAVLDEDQHTARVTLIRPGWSANGRYYSRATLEKALPIFEGAKAYANHPTKSELKERPERDIRDTTGWYEDVRQETDGRLTATRHIVGAAQSWLWPLVKVAASEKPDLIGLSINALGTTRMGEAEGRKGILVEAIQKVNSTDDVTTPAAGGSYDRLLHSDGDQWTRDLLTAMPITELQDTLREARPDVLAALQKEWKQPRDSKALETARADAAQAQQKADKLEKENRTTRQALEEALDRIAVLEKTALVDRLLEGRKFPAEWHKAIREELIAAQREQWDDILKREETKAKAIRGPVRVQGAGTQVSHAAAPAKGPTLFGLQEMARPDESPQEYVLRVKHLQESR